MISPLLTCLWLIRSKKEPLLVEAGKRVGEVREGGWTKTNLVQAWIA